ncbi:MAG: hypothetical protein RLZZ127_2694 [Planctomycetota bacterium]
MPDDQGEGRSLRASPPPLLLFVCKGVHQTTSRIGSRAIATSDGWARRSSGMAQAWASARMAELLTGANRPG